MILQGQSVPQMVPGGGTGGSVVQATNNGLYQQVGVPNQILTNSNPNQQLNHPNTNMNVNGAQQNLNGGPLMPPNQSMINGLPPNMNPHAGGRPRIMQNGCNLMGQALNPPVPNAPVRTKRPRAPKNPGGRGTRTPRSKVTQNQAQTQQMLQQNNMMNNMLNSHGGNMPPNLAGYHPQQHLPNQMQGIPQHHQQSNNFYNNDFEAWQQQQLNNSSINNCHPQNNRLANNTPPASMLPGSPNMMLPYSNLRRMNSNGVGVVGGPPPPSTSNSIGSSNPNRMMSPHQNYFTHQQTQQQPTHQLHHQNSGQPDVVFLQQNNSCDNNPQLQHQQQQALWHQSGNNNPTSSSSILNHYQQQSHQNNNSNNNANMVIQNNNPNPSPIGNNNSNSMMNTNLNQGLSNPTVQNHSNSNINNSAIISTANNSSNNMLQRSSSISHSPLPSNVIPGVGTNISGNNVGPHLQPQIMSSNEQLFHNNMNNLDLNAASTPNNQLNNQVASPYSNQPSSRPHSRTNSNSMSYHHNQPQNLQVNSAQQIQQPVQQNSCPNSLSNLVNPNDTIVFPITNGLVWGPNQINLDEMINQPLKNGEFYQINDFDLSENHLETIINRSDLDIAISSHLNNEPMQVCQWPTEEIQIRFNNEILCLDRSLVVDGRPAHKVARIKNLCKPGRNVIEISVTNLGEDPANPESNVRRKQASDNLKPFRFVAFMAHMPPLNLLLGGLQRRHTFDVARFVDIIETITANQSNKFMMVPLICPITRQRIRIPGRTTDCKHIDAFDMEAFLHKEVLWPRLCCPICKKSSPSGLDGLCIDLTVQFALNMFPPFIDSIYVNNEGDWCLTAQSPIVFPSSESPWQPIYGPMTKGVFMALNDPIFKNEKPQINNGNNLSDPPSIARSLSSLNSKNIGSNQNSNDEINNDSINKSNESCSVDSVGIKGSNQIPFILSKQDYSGIPKDLINFAAANTIILEPFLQTEYISFLEKYF